jgi:hypothetical protein
LICNSQTANYELQSMTMTHPLARIEYAQRDVVRFPVLFPGLTRQEVLRAPEDE